MKPKSRFFQANFSATLLRRAALAIAFLVLASPVRAEVVTLICQDEKMGESFTLRVDYDRKVVDMPNSADLPQSVGTAFNSAAATITEGVVEWEAVVLNPGGYIFRGSLNRLSGQGRVLYPGVYRDGRVTIRTLSGPCRRATQKF